MSLTNEYIYPRSIRSRGARGELGIPGAGGSSGGGLKSCCDPMGYGDVKWSQYPQYILPSSGFMEIYPANPRRIQLRILLLQTGSRVGIILKQGPTTFQPHTFNDSVMLEMFREALVVKHESDSFTPNSRHTELIPAPTTPIILIAGFNASAQTIAHVWEGEYSLVP